MVNEKFTPGEWKVIERPNPYFKNEYIYEIQWSKDGELVVECVYEKADAYLMSASKEMYESEKTNLELLKCTHEAYRNIALLIQCDPEVKAAWEQVFSPAMQTFAEKVVNELFQAIQRTEKALKKARGEE